jgi:tRNA dimethylallyltransferase
MSEPLKPLVILLGPTGSGKSDAALLIAETFSGEIVNADSIQLYRGFDIGSAKTPPDQRRGIPHHLIDVIEPEEVFTAGEYSRRAREAIANISGRGKLPVVAGGTGFYVRALLEGLFSGPERDDRLRTDLANREQRRTGFLHRWLRRYDPEAARRIHPNDRNKLMRAVEVGVLAGRPLTGMFAEGRDALQGYVPLKIAFDPPRPELVRKLDERAARMLAGGLMEEVRALLASGVAASAKPFESIGYKQALSIVLENQSHGEALEQMQRDTRRYAKRQMTWFKRERDLRWLSGFGTDETVQRSLMDTVATYLKSVRGETPLT